MIAGLGFGDTDSWEYGRRLLARNVPAQDAGPLFGQFYGFARAVIAASGAPLHRRPVSCPAVSAEEALALRVIEMAQRARHSETLSAATMLVGRDDLGDDLGTVFQAGQSLAIALAAHGLFPSGLPNRRKPARVAASISSRLRRPPPFSSRNP
ncbi:hypothetical protein [Roseiarcus fermentans]|uniref:hypothetical protein n=1 Tax=Roseiarcus fermentans TaxID=1473586 RepID=UPI0011BE422E|nr:hypothetical protein [Roseiarcus fermentans]